MSQSVDPEHFFQTTDSIAERERKAAKARSNKNGRPIKLGSKVLAILADPDDADRVYVAESAGVVRSVKLSTSRTLSTYRPPATPTSTYSAATTTASPLTSLALLSSSEPTLFAGSWTSAIYAFSVRSTKLLRTFTGGHTDFVKCLATYSLPGVSLLISGGADAKVVVWNALTGRKLHTLSGHVRGVLALVVDPFDGAVWSASSDREIKRWIISQNLASKDGSGGGKDKEKEGEGKVMIEERSQISTKESPFDTPLTPHETSVYALQFSNEGDLWTASADGNACRLERPDPQSNEHSTSATVHGAKGETTENSTAWQIDTTLSHGATNPLRALALSCDGAWVFTGGRDEDVWAWDAGSGEVHGKFGGHADEVYALDIARDGRVVSGSLDGTVRVWDVRDLASSTTAEGDSDDGGEGGGGDGDGDGDGDGHERGEGDGQQSGQSNEETKAPQLTAEEEAELAELMED